MVKKGTRIIKINDYYVYQKTTYYFKFNMFKSNIDLLNLTSACILILVVHLENNI